MSTEEAPRTAQQGFGSTEWLGQLPEPAMKSGPGAMTRRDYYSADQMLAYAAAAVATERERMLTVAWRAAVQAGLDERLRDYFKKRLAVLAAEA